MAEIINNHRAVIKTGEEWTLTETVALEELIIGKKAKLTVPEGKMLTLTVDGVELPIVPGSYQGSVVLTVTEDFPEIVDEYDIGNYRGALYVDRDGIDMSRSVTSALIGGSYENGDVDGVSIVSKNDAFTGLVYLAGEHEIKNTTIEMTGAGTNDFAGNGAGIVATGTSRVHAKNLKIRNKGMVRGAVLAADYGEIVIEDSEIECNGFDKKEAEAASKRINAMKEVPWMLGLYGNNRATNIVGSGKATYINCKLLAERWGVLSTDGVDTPKNFGDIQVRLNTKDSLVRITGDSGYGSYSIGATCNTFDNTEFDVPDYALVCANEYAGARFINGSKVTSGRFGVMWHKNQGGVLEVIDSEFKTGLATFMVKGCYPDIRVKNSKLESGNGVILQLMDCDDPGRVSEPVPLDASVPVKDPSHSVTDRNYADITMFHFPLKNYCTDLQASFEDVELNGDFLNAITNSCPCGMVIPEGQSAMQTGHGKVRPQDSSNAPINMVLRFAGSKVTGRISASTVKHRARTISEKNRREMGMVTNKVSPVVNNGVIVSFDSESVWTVTDTCYLSALSLDHGAVVQTIEGKCLTMTVDGVQKAIKPGHYAGEIVLTVTDDYEEIVDSFKFGGYRAAVFADENGVSKTKSVLSAVPGAKLGKRKISNVSIKSEDDCFNGLIFTGGEYELKDIAIELDGNGSNDFAGVGAGILATGDSKVVIDGLKVRAKGITRGTVLGADYTDLTIRNADIYAQGVSDEAQALYAEQAKSMCGVPWLLGLYGNNRATNIVGSGHVTYENSVIRAERWGVLSTDGTDTPKEFGDYSVELNTKDCLVEITGNSGYGSYSIGATKVAFDHTVVNVPDYAIVCANEYAASAFSNGTVVNSGRFGVMWHQNQNGVTHIADSVFHTGKTTFVVKGCYPVIEVERSSLQAGNGVILQLMDSDDPGMGNPMKEPLDTVAVKDDSHCVTGPNFVTANIFGRDISNTCTDAQVSFKDMNLVGDLYNSITNASGVGMVIPEGVNAMDASHAGKPEKSTIAPINLIVRMERVNYSGVISASTAAHRVKAISADNRRELGEVDNKVTPVVNNGVLVTLGEGTKWTVTGACCLSGLWIDPKAEIVGADGKQVVLTVDGKQRELVAGEYTGEITLNVK